MVGARLGMGLGSLLVLATLLVQRLGTLVGLGLRRRLSVLSVQRRALSAVRVPHPNRVLRVGVGIPTF